MKHKRVWSDEQRAAAAERMRRNNPSKVRWEKTAEEATAMAVKAQQVLDSNITSAAFIDRTPTTVTRDPEVQAVLDSMPEDRKVKLASIQARTLANLSQTKEGREALDRMEARHSGNIVPVQDIQPETVQAVLEAVISTEPPKPIVREVPMKVPFRITGSISGMCVSELGACQCGVAKLKWHPVCLKVKV